MNSQANFFRGDHHKSWVTKDEQFWLQNIGRMLAAEDEGKNKHLKINPYEMLKSFLSTADYRVSWGGTDKAECVAYAQKCINQLENRGLVDSEAELQWEVLSELKISGKRPRVFQSF